MQSQQPNHPNPPKATPGRRRANRHSLNSPARRTYASENDMPSELPFPLDFGSPSPLTPQRPVRNSPGPAAQSTNSKAKPRTGNKFRPKNVPTSPGPAKHGRRTPPQSAVPKSVADAAFAGGTFHASPAPSSLPIPSFLAKALDSPGVKDAGRVSQEPSPPATDSEAAPTPQHRPMLADTAREESPLDIFFRADRAEKEQARRASSANIFSTIPHPFSPPRQAPSPQEARTLPNGNGTGSLRARRPAGPQRTTSSGISSTELDGTPGKPMGPAFSTPYQERMRAARSSEKQPKSVHQVPSPQDTPADLSDKLKKFLAIPGMAQDANIPQSQSQTAALSATRPAGQASWTAQRVHPGTAPSLAPTPTKAEKVRPPNLLDMENSLRQMLKIGSGTNPGAAKPTNYRDS
ncbi:hypothetical protein B0H66DRAFT_531680 [Apodospora peruviana]|uniref:Proteophosphoglycan 5 n=1 Tax=Apodospora peruviana TaxID=516989 RepID=A0AAE0M7I8_9PEZI|nr:hypothetical protein B0H66DRAFT_531680 [Apodospora peruviana]